MMADYEQSTAGEGLSRGRLATAALTVGAFLVALLTLIWAGVQFWELGTRAKPPATLQEFLAVAATLLGGWGFALLLWGAAEILRRLDELIDAQRGVPRSLAGLGLGAFPGRAAGPDPRIEQTPVLEELVRLTRELRDIELLSPEEKAARVRLEGEELSRQLAEEIPLLLREHNLAEAQRRLQVARRRCPGLPAWDTLAEQIEMARTKFETHDLRVASREIDDLIALGAWERAVEIVRHLRQRHPSSEQVEALARRVAAGRERATAEERARLMSQAQEATNRKEWVEALRLVEQVIDRFPDSLEAHDLRPQIPILRANVEIQTRQEMESQIREYVKQMRFADAVRVADELIAKYPESPQAAVLREQLPRLRQKAAATS